MSEERLEEIKSRVWKDKGTYAMGDENQREGYIYTLSDYDYKWLIEQVKRVQGLERCLGELIKQNKEMRKSAGFYNSETYNAHLERLLDSREKQIQDLRIDVSFYKMASERYEYVEQQNKRYREALEFYAEQDNYRWEISYRPQQEIDCMVIDDGGHTARKALKGGYEW